ADSELQPSEMSRRNAPSVAKKRPVIEKAVQGSAASPSIPCAFCRLAARGKGRFSETADVGWIAAGLAARVRRFLDFLWSRWGIPADARGRVGQARDRCRFRRNDEGRQLG